MTYEELLAKIDEILETTMPSIGAGANVPIRTGRLRSAIKLEKSGENMWTIYLDTVDISLDDWATMYPGGAKITDSPTEVAPYGPEVDSYNHYWLRVADLLAQQIKSALGGSVQGTKADYTER